MEMVKAQLYKELIMANIDEIMKVIFSLSHWGIRRRKE